MEELIIHFIVAGAFLFLIRWCAVNFRSQPEDEATCGSCPSCETKPEAAGISASAGTVGK